MTGSMFVLWAIVGWCGTAWPWWWWRHWRFPPPPPPDPEPWWFIRDIIISKIIGVVGGIVGGVIFTQVFGPASVAGKPQPDPWMPVVVAATAVGAFLGASLLVDTYGMIAGRRNTKNG